MTDKDDRIFAFLLEDRFSGDLQKGKTFCEHFSSYVDVERIFGCAKKDDRPVLDCVMKMFSNIQDTEKNNLINKVNGHLKSLGKYPILEADIAKFPFNFKEISDENEDTTFQDRNRRMEIFQMICNSACEEWRVIAHFLLDYNKIQEISINKQNEVKERLCTILEEWQTYTPGNQATWIHMKALLMFLSKRALVSQIDEELGHSPVNSDHLYRAFRDIYHSDEKVKFNQYSADVASIVPEEFSIIHSFIESMKEKNKNFDKREVLDELTKEIRENLNKYKDLSLNPLEAIERYKETGVTKYPNNQFKLVINGLANAFKLSINLLTQDKTSNFYLQTPHIYRSRVEPIENMTFLIRDNHVNPSKNVKLLNSTNQSIHKEAIKLICVKDDYCILEVPEKYPCTRVVIKTITKKQDCPADIIYDVDEVEKETFNGYVYFRLKGLDKKNSYEGLIECKDEDGNKHQYNTREFSLTEKLVECHTRMQGYTVITHNADKDSASPMAFQNKFRVKLAERETKDMSVSEWIDRCENYLNCNLIENKKENFDEWIIFPNIFTKNTQNVTTEVAKKIRDTLSNIQDKQTAVGGVIIMYYDSEEHKNFLLKQKSDENTRDFDNRVLIFHQELGALLNIRVTESTHPTHISDEFERCSKDADDLATLMDFLIEQHKITSPKTTIATFVAAPNIHSDALKATIFKEEQTLICDGCIPRIITRDHLENLKEWLQNKLQHELRTISLRSEPEKQVILKPVIAQICGFYANTSIKAAYHPDDVHEQILHLQANNEQIQVVLDPQKHKVVKGPLGCGKTVVATLQLEFLARIAKERTTLFFISLDPFSLIDVHIGKHFEVLKLENVENKLVNLRITNVSEIAEEMGLEIIPSISQILGHIKEQEKDIGITHIFIDEINSFNLSKVEVELINKKLSSMKDNFIMFLLQAIQHQQFYIEGVFKRKTCAYETYETELDMIDMPLKKIMRNSVKISESLEVAKEIISGEETHYYYPASGGTLFENETDQKPQTDEPSTTIRRSDNSSRHGDGNALSDQCDTTILTEDVNTPGITKIYGNQPVPMKNQEHALKQMSAYGGIRSYQGTVIKYLFERSTEIGHSHQGKEPELMYIPSDNEIKSFLSKIPPSKCKEKQKQILKVALCLVAVKAGDIIICHDEEEFLLMRHALDVAKKDFVTYAPCLEGKNKIPSAKEKKDVLEAIDGGKKIVLTDTNGCRGFQIRNAVIPLSATEKFHRSAILENAARATSNILFLITNCSYLPWFRKSKFKFRKVIEKWDSQKMIRVIKPEFKNELISTYVGSLPLAETLLQRIKQRKPTKKPTFKDFLHLIHDNKDSSVRELIKSNPANMKIRDGKKTTLLMVAAINNNSSMVKMLLECGAEVGEKNFDSQTAIHCCAEHNSINCMALLLSRAPHDVINIRNDNLQQTALHLASQLGHIEIVELLLNYKIDSRLKDVLEETAYDVACEKSGDAEMKRRIREVILQHEKSIHNEETFSPSQIPYRQPRVSRELDSQL